MMPASLGDCWVDSEVAPLRRVLVHRPGRELEYVLPDTRGDLLFDEVPWLAAAQREHDELAALIESHGVEVYYLDQLLAKAVCDVATRDEAIDAALTAHAIGEHLGRPVRNHLRDLAPEELAAVLIGGLPADSVADLPRSPRTEIDAKDLLIGPLPNQQFVRDSSSWIGPNLSVNTFALAARRRESAILASALTGANGASLWPEGTPSTPLEGGDILVAGPRCVLIGIGQRTTTAGAEALAVQLLRRHPDMLVIAVSLPRSRQTMHLDTVATMVAEDAILLSQEDWRGCTAYRLEPGSDGGLRVTQLDNPFSEVAGALGVPRMRVIHTGGDTLTQRREQWTDAANVLALRPGVVVAYDRNVHTNQALTRAGITVFTTPSAELSRGRGGPHCLTAPLLRRYATDAATPLPSGEDRRFVADVSGYA